MSPFSSIFNGSCGSKSSGARRPSSAVSLLPAVQAGVVANLTQRYGAGLNIQFSQNPALVGGLRVKVGSDVYDGSVAARLTALAESL